jgi:hypothetical protein
MSLRGRLKDTTFKITLPGLHGKRRSWTVRSTKGHGIPHPERSMAVVPRRDTIVDYRRDDRSAAPSRRRIHTFAPRTRRGPAGPVRGRGTR